MNTFAARDKSINESIAKELQEEYEVEIIHSVCDVTDENSVKETVQKTVVHFGKIDILINSAGINIRGAIEVLSVSDFNKVQQANVTGS